VPDKSTEQRDTKKLLHKGFWLVLMQRFMRVAMMLGRRDEMKRIWALWLTT
jgi:hypothetical protein